jgi:hypothetical protein
MTLAVFVFSANIPWDNPGKIVRCDFVELGNGNQRRE